MTVFLVIVLGLAFLIGVLQIPLQAAGVGLVLAGLWWLSLRVWPDKRCGSCSGMGSFSGPLGWSRTCGECQGLGRVPRIGSGR